MANSAAIGVKRARTGLPNGMRIMVEQAPAPHLEGKPHRSSAVVRRLAEKQTPERVGLIGLFVLSVMYTLYFAREVLLPICLALILSMILRPVVTQLRRLGIPESVGAAALVAGLLALFVAGIYELSAPASDWIQRGPVIMRELQFKLSDLQASIQEAREATKKIEELASAEQEVTPVVVQGPGLAEALLTQTQAVILNLIIMLVLVYFFLASGRRTLEQLLGATTNIENRVHLATLAATIQRNIARYLLTITLINAGLGVAVAAAMALVGMPNPGLWGVVAGLLNFIPYLGAATTLVILTIVALLSFDQMSSIVLPPLVFLALTTLEGQFITPTIVGRRLTLNPIAVFIAILLWGWIWGIPGALLAVPILATFKIVCDATKPLQPLGALLGG